jgi:hypothetical protein
MGQWLRVVHVGEMKKYPFLLASTPIDRIQQTTHIATKLYTFASTSNEISRVSIRAMSTEQPQLSQSCKPFASLSHRSAREPVTNVTSRYKLHTGTHLRLYTQDLPTFDATHTHIYPHTNAPSLENTQRQSHSRMRRTPKRLQRRVADEEDDRRTAANRAARLDIDDVDTTDEEESTDDKGNDIGLDNPDGAAKTPRNPHSIFGGPHPASKEATPNDHGNGHTIGSHGMNPRQETPVQSTRQQSQPPTPNSSHPNRCSQARPPPTPTPSRAIPVSSQPSNSHLSISVPSTPKNHVRFPNIYILCHLTYTTPTPPPLRANALIAYPDASIARLQLQRKQYAHPGATVVEGVSRVGVAPRTMTEGVVLEEVERRDGTRVRHVYWIEAVELSYEMD